MPAKMNSVLSATNAHERPVTEHDAVAAARPRSPSRHGHAAREPRPAARRGRPRTSPRSRGRARRTSPDVTASAISPPISAPRPIPRFITRAASRRRRGAAPRRQRGQQRRLRGPEEAVADAGHRRGEEALPRRVDEANVAGEADREETRARRARTPFPPIRSTSVPANGPATTLTNRARRRRSRPAAPSPIPRTLWR